MFIGIDKKRKDEQRERDAVQRLDEQYLRGGVDTYVCVYLHIYISIYLSIYIYISGLTVTVTVALAIDK